MITEIPISTETKCAHNAQGFRQDRSFRDQGRRGKTGGADVIREAGDVWRRFPPTVHIQPGSAHYAHGRFVQFTGQKSAITVQLVV
jgi:hypothetical protein